MKNYVKSFWNRRTLVQFARLGLIGGLNTILYFIMLNIFLTYLTPFWSVTIAFGLATGLSYLLNRRWTFGLREGFGSVRESATFYVVNLLAWAVTAGMVQIAQAMSEDELTRLEVNAVAIFATGLILLPKFASYRDLVFRRSLSNADRT